MTLEETRRRTEASLARKRMMNPNLSNGTNATVETPNAAVSSGAMDSLLEKLRAAAPQARDQRDRRRRARLKERHNVRVASGQHPEGSEADEPNDADADANHNNTTGSAAGDDAASMSETGLLSPPPGQDDRGGGNGNEDVADRAASMLQGLRDNTDDGERSRRRRESAEEERRKRRMRRRNGTTSGSKDSGDGTGALSSVRETMASPDESVETEAGADAGPEDEAEDEAEMVSPPSTPAIVVSPNADVNTPRSPSDTTRSLEGTPPGRALSESD